MVEKAPTQIHPKRVIEDIHRIPSELTADQVYEKLLEMIRIQSNSQTEFIQFRWQNTPFIFDKESRYFAIDGKHRTDAEGLLKSFARARSESPNQ